MIHCVLAVSRVARSIGDEDAIKVVGDFMNGIVIGEDGDGSTTPDQAAKDVFFDSTIDDRDVCIAGAGADVEWGFGADFVDEIDLLRVDEGLVLICIILLANCNACKRGTLFTKIGDDSSSINTRYSRYTLLSAPFTKALNRSPMAVVFRNIGNDHTCGLQIGGFEVSK